jgi:hypothetical protein
VILLSLVSCLVLAFFLGISDGHQHLFLTSEISLKRETLFLKIKNGNDFGGSSPGVRNNQKNSQIF